MRCFIAIPLPEEIHEELSKIQAQLKEVSADIRWVKIENIHLTLKFLGEVDESKIKTISEELKKTVREHTSFESCIGKLGTFPTLLNPKIIWIGIRKNEDKMNKLQQAIEEIMEPLGLKKETRAFSSHLTLGRVRSKKNIQKLTKKFKTLSLPQTNPFTIEKIALFQSILKLAGAEYTVLDEFKLADK